MTTLHNPRDLGIGDSKFKFIMLFGVPSIGLILGFICGQLLPCYMIDCTTTIGKNNSEMVFIVFWGIGIATFLIIRNFTKILYERGLKIYHALDIQNDECFTCKKKIAIKDEFYFAQDHIYCLQHYPNEQPNRKEDKQ